MNDRPKLSVKRFCVGQQTQNNEGYQPINRRILKYENKTIEIRSQELLYILYEIRTHRFT